MTDQRALHDEALAHLDELEKVIDLLKHAGPHPLDGNNALLNIAERSEHLARRARRGL